MELYRPVGLGELLLIAEGGFRAYPPRLEWQPIFYPVLHREYAIQIARDWNTKDAGSGFAGFVTRFSLPDEYSGAFPVQVVGDENLHQELWVPAEQLAELNAQLQGKIGVTDIFLGERYQGPDLSHLLS